MSVPVIHESEVESLDLPGRNLRWLVNEERLGAKHLSMCVIRVEPGQTVRPAHSHPNGEEVIYVVSGSGRVLVNGEVSPVREGCAVLFPQGQVHMLQNSGDIPMKVACFFAPATNLENYKFFEDVEFPQA
jgi:quercetin dioxygenase-like cupin family protein